MIIDNLKAGHSVNYDRLLEYLYHNSIDANVLECVAEPFYVVLSIPKYNLTIQSDGELASKQ